jgi:hypothetical protein
MMTNELDAAQKATSGFGSIQVRLAKAGRIGDQLLRDIVKNRVLVLNPQQQSELLTGALRDFHQKVLAWETPVQENLTTNMPIYVKLSSYLLILL